MSCFSHGCLGRALFFVLHWEHLVSFTYQLLHFEIIFLLGHVLVASLYCLSIEVHFLRLRCLWPIRFLSFGGTISEHRLEVLLADLAIVEGGQRLYHQCHI